MFQHQYKKSSILYELEQAIKKKVADKPKPKEQVQKNIQNSLEKRKNQYQRHSIDKLPKSKDPIKHQKMENVTLFNNENLAHINSHTNQIKYSEPRKFNNRKIDKLFSLINYTLSSADKAMKYINFANFEAEFAVKLFQSDKDNLSSEMRGFTLEQIMESSWREDQSKVTVPSIIILQQENLKLKKELTLLEKQNERSRSAYNPRDLDLVLVLRELEIEKYKEAIYRLRGSEFQEKLSSIVDKQLKYESLLRKGHSTSNQFDSIFRSLISQRNNLCKDFNSAKKNEENAHEQQKINRIKLEKQELLKEIEACKKKLGDMTEVAVLKSEIESLKKQHSKIRSKILVEVPEKADQSISLLELIDGFVQEHKNWRENEAHLEIAKTELKVSEKQIKHSQERLQELDQQNTQLHEQIQKKSFQIQKLQEEFRKLKKDCIEHIRQQKTVNKANQQLKDRIHELQMQLEYKTTKEQQSQQINTAVRKLQQELQQAYSCSQSYQEEIQQLKSQLEAKTQSYLDQVQQIKDIYQGNLKNKEGQYNRGVDNLQRQLSGLRAELQEKIVKFKLLADEMNGLRQISNHKDQQLNKLEKQIDSYIDELQQIQTTNDELTKKLRDQQTLTEDQNRQFKRMSQQLQRSRHKLTNQQLRIGQLEANERGFKQTIAELKDNVVQLSTLAERMPSVEKNLRQKSIQAELVRAQLQAKIKEISELKGSIVTQRQQKNSENSQKQIEIEQKQQQLQRKELDLIQKQEQLNIKQEQLQQKVHSLKKTQKQLLQKQQKLITREQEISELQEILQKKQIQIEKQEQIQIQKNEEIQSKFQEHQDTVMRIQEDFVKKEKEFLDKERMLVLKDKQILEKEQVLIQKEHQLMEREQILLEKEQEDTVRVLSKQKEQKVETRDWEREVDNLNLKIEELQKINCQNSQLLSNKQIQITQITKQFHNTKQQLTHTKQALETQTKITSQTTINQNNLQQQNQVLQQKLSNLQESLAQTLIQKEQAHASNTILLKSQQTEITDLQIKLEESAGLVVELKENLEIVKQELVEKDAQFQAREMILLQRCNMLQQELIDKDQVELQAEENRVTSEKQIQEKDCKISEIAGKLKLAEIKIEEGQSMIEFKQAKISEADNKIKELQQKLIAKQNQINSLTFQISEISSHPREDEELQDKLSSLQEKVEEYEETLHEKQSYIADLRKSISDLTSQMEVLKEQKKQLEDKYENLIMKFEFLMINAKEAVSAKEEGEQQISQMQYQIQELTEQCKNLAQWKTVQTMYEKQYCNLIKRILKAIIDLDQIGNVDEMNFRTLLEVGSQKVIQHRMRVRDQQSNEKKIRRHLEAVDEETTIHQFQPNFEAQASESQVEKEKQKLREDCNDDDFPQAKESEQIKSAEEKIESKNESEGEGLNDVQDFDNFDEGVNASLISEDGANEGNHQQEEQQNNQVLRKFVENKQEEPRNIQIKVNENTKPTKKFIENSVQEKEEPVQQEQKQIANNYGTDDGQVNHNLEQQLEEEVKPQQIEENEKEDQKQTQKIQNKLLEVQNEEPVKDAQDQQELEDFNEVESNNMNESMVSNELEAQNEEKNEEVGLGFDEFKDNNFSQLDSSLISEKGQVNTVQQENNKVEEETQQKGEKQANQKLLTNNEPQAEQENKDQNQNQNQNQNQDQNENQNLLENLENFNDIGMDVSHIEDNETSTQVQNNSMEFDNFLDFQNQGNLNSSMVSEDHRQQQNQQEPDNEGQGNDFDDFNDFKSQKLNSSVLSESQIPIPQANKQFPNNQFSDFDDYKSQSMGNSLMSSQQPQKTEEAEKQQIENDEPKKEGEGAEMAAFDDFGEFKSEDMNNSIMSQSDIN